MKEFTSFQEWWDNTAKALEIPEEDKAGIGEAMRQELEPTFTAYGSAPFIDNTNPLYQWVKDVVGDVLMRFPSLNT